MPLPLPLPLGLAPWCSFFSATLAACALCATGDVQWFFCCAIQHSTAQYSRVPIPTVHTQPCRGGSPCDVLGWADCCKYCAKPIVNRLGSAQPPSNITVQYCRAVAAVGDKVVLAVAQCASGLSGLDFGRFGHPSVQPSALQQRCARLTLLRPPEPCSHELAAYDQLGVSAQDIGSAQGRGGASWTLASSPAGKELHSTMGVKRLPEGRKIGFLDAQTTASFTGEGHDLSNNDSRNLRAATWCPCVRRPTCRPHHPRPQRPQRCETLGTPATLAPAKIQSGWLKTRQCPRRLVGPRSRPRIWGERRLASQQL